MSTEPLFDPFTTYDGLCTFAIFVGSMIAAGGGLGGGGVFVPIYILVLSFSTKEAAALSQATIFGGSIINLLMNMRVHHPTRHHRPLTDFPTLLVFEPMLLVGTVIGVLLNVMFPSMLILILLIVTLLYATFRTANKARRMWTSESEALREKASFAGYITDGAGPTADQGYDTTESTKLDDEYGDTDFLLIKPESTSHDFAGDSYGSTEKLIGEADTSSFRAMSRMCGVDISQLSRAKMEYLEPLMEREKQVWQPLVVIAIVWVISSCTSLGKNDAISGVEACSALYWLITFISFPVLFVISLYITRKQFYEDDNKERSGAWTRAEGDIKWNRSLMNMVKYPLIAMFAGLLGGLLGIGGGMIVSPLLMELGVLPSVAAATSAMCVMITSSSATLQFVLLGYLNLDYTFYFMSIGIVGTFVGQTVVSYCVREYGRKSLIVFSVAAIMGGAVLLMGIDGVLQAVEGVDWTFQAAC